MVVLASYWLCDLVWNDLRVSPR